MARKKKKKSSAQIATRSSSVTSPRATTENQKRKKAQVTIHERTFSGPIPAPEVLAHYENINIGLANRIVKMAEKEQNHRHTLVETEQSLRFSEAKRGQLYALLIGSLALACGTYTALSGAEIAGTIIGGGGVIGLVSVFILGRSKKKYSETNESGNKKQLKKK